MILRSPTEHENGELRHAGMDGRHPGVQDASGDIHVNLDSSTPCWNDAIEGVLRKLTEALHRYFQRRHEEHEGFGYRSLKLRHLRAFVVRPFPLTPSCCFVTVPLLCQLAIQGRQLWKTKLLSMI